MRCPRCGSTLTQAARHAGQCQWCGEAWVVEAAGGEIVVTLPVEDPKDCPCNACEGARMSFGQYQTGA